MMSQESWSDDSGLSTQQRQKNSKSPKEEEDSGSQQENHSKTEEGERQGHQEGVIERCRYPKKWNEQVETISKRTRDDKEVKIVEPATKMICTGKERAVDEDEDDEVVIVKPPARDEKEMEEMCLKNRKERQLRLSKVSVSLCIIFPPPTASCFFHSTIEPLKAPNFK
ncbi:hypothetical protein F4604DRAFT_1685785 [Suillus subluteus]|nr:hypothetical protein F4604DRAFT_1685785 [Suillus subluteus]